MNTIFDLKEQLDYIYALPCPSCGNQWTYKINSNTSWTEIRNCGCSEYFKLIDERRSIYLFQQRQDK